MDRSKRPVDTSLVVGVDLGLGLVRRLDPAVHGGINSLHGQVGPLDEPHLHLATPGVVTGRGPGADPLERTEGVGQVGLQHDPRIEVPKFGLVKQVGERPDGQLEVTVLLHIEVHEGRPP